MSKSKFRPEVKTHTGSWLRAIKQATGESLDALGLVERLAAMGGPEDDTLVTTMNMILTECSWSDKRKPFFNVHAPVINALSRSSLAVKPEDIPRSVVHDLGVLCIKLPIDLQSELLQGIEHFFVMLSNTMTDVETSTLIDRKCLAVGYAFDDSCMVTSCYWDDDFEMASSRQDGPELTTREVEQRRLVCRIAIGVMMLAADPEFITPVLLNRDKGRKVDLETLVKRAKQRGVHGYEIGADMEVSPHFRRPHFAIRWTGKGSTVPKLVHVKGAVIHKSALQDVPTGYEAG